VLLFPMHGSEIFSDKPQKYPSSSQLMFTKCKTHNHNCSCFSSYHLFLIYFAKLTPFQVTNQGCGIFLQHFSYFQLFRSQGSFKPCKKQMHTQVWNSTDSNTDNCFSQTVAIPNLQVFLTSLTSDLCQESNTMFCNKVKIIWSLRILCKISQNPYHVRTSITL
jgi:hypothetical protein